MATGTITSGFFSTYEQRCALADKANSAGITMNGEPAQVSGTRMMFALVNVIGKPYMRAEYAWETVEHVLGHGGNFKA